MQTPFFFHRDISWLAFNHRLLQEAKRPNVPLMEQIKLLSIYSSNLDEFYRVRMPVLLALKKMKSKKGDLHDEEGRPEERTTVQTIIQAQLEEFGHTLHSVVLPALKENNIELVYNRPQPPEIETAVTHYFFDTVLAFLLPVELTEGTSFFPENNQLYFALLVQRQQPHPIILNIPSDKLPRFFCVPAGGKEYIVFLDDVIRWNVAYLFNDATVAGSCSFKITRDAALDFSGEYADDIARQLERQLLKRDQGLATRFLYQPGLPQHALDAISQAFNLNEHSLVQGGHYHNLKDLGGLPVKNNKLWYPNWPAVNYLIDKSATLLSAIAEKDSIIHTPYQSYHTILRFFNEAAANPEVAEIFVTLYRVAHHSQIVQALMSAAKNGKKVNVLIELKARFDEANNVKWAREMKSAGVKIIYSISSLKVHAKMALVKLKDGARIKYAGLLSTGNLNETTAALYTDHILLTAHAGLMQEMELLFLFLAKSEKVAADDTIIFRHLLVSQFNLLPRFIGLIDDEIANAKAGLPASVTLKLNNLEEKVLIKKLYEASAAGVKIVLIVRGICCLIPGKAGLSSTISVRRIIDRYLEHGRIFIFGNNGNPNVFLGSADWMNRNIYHRIEVCFPIYDVAIKEQLLQLVALQLQDNVQAVMVDENLNNVPVNREGKSVRSQEAIYQLLKTQEAVL